MICLLNAPQTVWLFDYDLTLYAESERGVLNALDGRISLYVQKTVGCTFEEAQLIRKKYWSDFGTTLAGLRAKYGVAPDDFFDFIHIPDFLVYPEKSPQKRELLLSLKGPRYIFTNGRSDWSRVGSAKMGILDCFKRIVGLEDLSWDGKPQNSAYEKMESVLIKDESWDGKNPHQLILLDDSLKNLKSAAERGWTTVWINSVSDEDGSFVNARIANLMELDRLLKF